MAVLTVPIGSVRAETPRNLAIFVDLASDPFPFRAGQHARLGARGRPDRRPYSIACSPSEARRRRGLEFLIQVDESASPGPHLPRLVPGVLVDVEGPAGSFVLPASLRGHDFLFVGGGTGIAPLRAMLWEVLEEEPGAKVAMMQSARNPGELAYATEFRTLAREGRISLVEAASREAPDGWKGSRGRVGVEELAPLVTGRTLCFVCGPDSLVQDIPRLLEKLGAKEVRTEHWAG